MVVYLFLCIISILAGRAILHVIGVKREPFASHYLSREDYHFNVGFGIR